MLKILGEDIFIRAEILYLKNDDNVYFFICAKKDGNLRSGLYKYLITNMSISIVKKIDLNYDDKIIYSSTTDKIAYYIENGKTITILDKNNIEDIQINITVIKRLLIQTNKNDISLLVINEENDV